MDLNKIHCLSVGYATINRVVVSSVTLSFPTSLLTAGQVAASNTCIAIWDTGATGSAITELTAKKMNLAPTGIKHVSGLGGTIAKKTYLVDLLLPNNVRIPNIAVTEIDNPKDSAGNIKDDFGMLIGMDIICMGDFAISNFEGKTVMSFRIPSMCKTDYVAEWNRRKAVENKYKRK